MDNEKSPAWFRKYKFFTCTCIYEHMYRCAYKIKECWEEVHKCRYKKEEGKRETECVFHVHAFEHKRIHAY